jgi:hypothetical protein
MRSLAALLLVAGCGAELQIAGDGGTDGASGDGRGARACTGGDGHATDAGGNCFVWFKAPKVWTDAQTACYAIQAHLAIITSAPQNTVIDGLTKGHDTFLGATDAVTEGTFLWVDGTPVTYANYHVGEPNNGSGAYQEDCLVIAGARTPSDSWDDRPCAPPPTGAGAYAYLCEY